MSKKYNLLNFFEAWSELDKINLSEETGLSINTPYKDIPFNQTKVSELVYHGSEAKNLSKFDFKYKYGSKVFAWFTPNFEGAKCYALDESGYVHSAYINITNPLDLRHISLCDPVFNFKGSESCLSESGVKLATALKISPTVFYARLKSLRSKIENLEFIEITEDEYFLFDYIKSPFFRLDFEKTCPNYDGLICKDDQGVSYAVKENNQIHWVSTLEVEDDFVS